MEFLAKWKGALFMCDYNYLVDEKNGKKVDWRTMKRESNMLARVYEMIAESLTGVDNIGAARYYKKAKKVSSCNSSLLFAYEKGGDIRDKKLVYCNNCHDRGCRLCQHKKSRVHAYQLNKIMRTALKEFDNLDFIFATFTMKNVENSPVALKSAIKQMNGAFHKMNNYSRLVGKNGRKIAPVDRVIKGSIRSLEVTYNAKTDTLHPHLHVIFAVDRERYFDVKEDNYIDQTEWIKLWQKALGVDYAPSVHVEVIKANKRKGIDSLLGSVLEIAKYETKPDSAFVGAYGWKKAMKVVYSLSEGLAGVRSFGFAGVLKDIKSEIFGKKNLDDVSDEEMINADGESEIDIDSCVFVQYRWCRGEQDYIEVPLERSLMNFIREKFSGKAVA